MVEKKTPVWYTGSNYRYYFVTYHKLYIEVLVEKVILLWGDFFFKITPYFFGQKVLYIPKDSGLGGHVISFQLFIVAIEL